jgi:hypothetical protein
MNLLERYVDDLAWELTIDKTLNHEAIKEMLNNLVELAKNAGKMELNAKHDIKIDQFNPFNN